MSCEEHACLLTQACTQHRASHVLQLELELLEPYKVPIGSWLIIIQCGKDGLIHRAFVV